MWRWATALGRTPRELLAATTAAEITEAMAFEQLEPFGALHQEQMAGAVCAVLANIHSQPGAKALGPADFMPALRRALGNYAAERPQQMTAAERADGIRRLIGGKGSRRPGKP